MDVFLCTLHFQSIVESQSLHPKGFTWSNCTHTIMKLFLNISASTNTGKQYTADM
jgi:hypothetical protein